MHATIHRVLAACDQSPCCACFWQGWLTSTAHAATTSSPNRLQTSKWTPRLVVASLLRGSQAIVQLLVQKSPALRERASVKCPAPGKC